MIKEKAFTTDARRKSSKIWFTKNIVWFHPIKLPLFSFQKKP